ncbi:MAG: hypothetical protein ABW203_08950 [Novosphingobium sp.]
MPEWTVYVALALAFISALTVSAHVQVKSTQHGDGLVKMWVKGGCAGAATMIGVIAAFLLVANVVNALAG